MAAMNIRKSTRKYEAWLSSHIPVLESDVQQKHTLMAQAVFPFLRATFYRWAQTFPKVCPDAARATPVLGVGDLHVENFGTWRDAEGRLIWGLNDFDEACRLPFTCDLVRLATSTHFAIAADHLKIAPARAVDALLEGYAVALERGGGPIVLAEHHIQLRAMAVERLKDPSAFWNKLEALKTLREKLPRTVGKELDRAMPKPTPKYRVAHRVSGLGSLGRRRYVAIAEWHGGLIAREAKELAPSAWLWGRGEDEGAQLHYGEILDRSIRCRDPFVWMRGRWLVRRLAPDCSRIELSSLPAKHDAVRLLHAMGFETANVHLGTATPRKLAADLARRDKRWLHVAAEAMVASVNQDWQAWREGQATSNQAISKQSSRAARSGR
jgi:hypothetical protein